MSTNSRPYALPPLIRVYKILERVHVVFVRLGMFPLLGRPTDEQNAHCLVVGKTGLLIFYTFDTDTVTIVRILHERQERN